VEPELRLEQTPHGSQVYYRGRRLYGPRPEIDAGRRAAAVGVPSDTLVLWFSPLVWHGWRELAETIGGSTDVVALEVDPLLLELSRRTRPEELSDRFSLIPATDGEMLAALRRAGEHRYRRVVEVTTSASSLVHRAAYRALRDLAEREIRVFWQNRLTLSAMGRLWIRNLVENLPELMHADALPALCGPVVVCGAGPSLEAALPAIARNRSAVRVLAVDTAVPVLDAVGVRPDVVIALEGQLANAYDFLPVTRRDYRLVTDLTSDPTTARLHAFRSWTLTAFAPVGLLDRAAALPGVAAMMPALGSVGVAAVRLAAMQGASPIVLAGLDFAVLPGTTHARGAPAYLNAFATCDRLRRPTDAALAARLVRLPGPHGPVASTLVLKGYADELRSLVAKRTDVFVLEPIGLDVGAPSIDREEFSRVAAAVPAATSASSARPTTTADERRARLAAFVRAEIELLDSVDLSDGSGVDELPERIDYLASEIPERIESLSGRVCLAPLDRSARARLRITADYYRDRWSATLGRLKQ